MKKHFLILIITILFFADFWIIASVYDLSQNKFRDQSELLETKHTIIGKDAYKDKFPVVVGEYEDIGPIKDSDKVLGETIEKELKYKKVLIEMPLFAQDYYYGKHANATAGINEINLIPVLVPGNRISIIGDGYMTMSPSRGYISPGSGFMFASGSCWSASALGFLMDEVNKTFEQKYDIPLFVFSPGDRRPHPHWYRTYQYSNVGYGYSVLKSRLGGTDYRFTVNPQVATLPKFKDLKIKIVMFSQTNHPNAYLGQAIGGYLRSNVDF